MLIVKLFLSITIFSLVYIILAYNYISSAAEDVRKNKNNISVELDRRFKIFESLININFRYSEDMKNIVKEFYYIHKQEQEKKTVLKNQHKSSVSEKYLEDFCSKTIFLQDEVVKTENRLADAKKKLNQSIYKYKCARNYLFCPFIISNFNPGLDNKFFYWGIDKEEILEKENYSIHL